MDGDEDVSMEGTNGFADPKELARSFNNALDGGEVASDESDQMLYDEDDEEASFDPRPHPDVMQRLGLVATGVCYDERMKLHANADFGTNDHHPEDPARIEEIFKTLRKAGLVFDGTDAELLKLAKTNPTKYLWRIPAREATEGEICLAHTAVHYSWVRDLSRTSTIGLRKMCKDLDQGRSSHYVGSMTFESALVSAGGAIETCLAVVRGDVKNAMAVIRPPGHHAESHSAMGFCIFNNVPIAVHVARQTYPDLCRKVLILDWDVHHGNGIQHMFYSDPNVLYISLHVFKNGSFYPGQSENPMDTDGDLDKCGSGPGLGRNVNIGWHDQGMGDGEYMAAFQKIVMPIAQEFDPDLVVISAGFDAADGDTLGGCLRLPACYAHMTHMLKSLANGKVAACLEGGYNLRSISQSALAVVRTLMGEPPPRMDSVRLRSINREAAYVLARVRAFQAPYWECLRPGIVDVQDLQQQGAERAHDVLRESQRLKLSAKLGMVPLYIQRDVLYKSYENQVLVTQDIQAARDILMIIHDPPEFVAQPDIVDNSTDLHNAWFVDGVQQYIKWAFKEGFGVMDVNIPRYITQVEGLNQQDMDSFTPRMSESQAEKQIHDVVCYLWDNYLQLYEAENIFVLGVGNSYVGIKFLLLNRDCKSRISGVVNFVTGNLRPVKSDVDQNLSTWYRDNSRVFVSRDHACWTDPKLARKVTNRRYGDVHKSQVAGLNRMMNHHATEAQKWILGRRGASSVVDRNATEEAE